MSDDAFTRKQFCKVAFMVDTYRGLATLCETDLRKKYDKYRSNPALVKGVQKLEDGHLQINKNELEVEHP